MRKVSGCEVSHFGRLDRLDGGGAVATQGAKNHVFGVTLGEMARNLYVANNTDCDIW